MSNPARIKPRVPISSKAGRIVPAPPAISTVFNAGAFSIFLSATLALPVALPLVISLMPPLLAPCPAHARASGAARAERLSFESLAGGSGIVGLNYGSGQDGYPVVSDLYKNGPAEKAGMKIGDEILAVGDEDAKYIGYLHLQTLLTGAGGTSLTLKLKQGDATRTITIERATVDSFKDPNLRKHEVAKWQREEAAPGPADHLIDLPFAMLGQEHNRPTLFEFTDKESDPSITGLLKKHSDGTYIFSHCRIVRITKDNPDYNALHKYLGLQGDYALIPVYQPWLVTVKDSDIISALPGQARLNQIARSLVHNSIKVQVSHTVARLKGRPEADFKLNKRSGLAHRPVYKRICQELPEGWGIIGLGFAPAPDGTAETTQVFARGPAEKAGIKPGDRIREINGQDTKMLGLEHIQTALAGPVGQSVTLTFDQGKVGKGQTPSVHKLTLKFEPVSTFEDPSLAKITISKWQRVLSDDVDDSDEYELPSVMLGQVEDTPTIFEFCQNHGDPSASAVLNALIAEGKLSNPRLQVVTYTSSSPLWEALRKNLRIAGSYACLPVYDRSKHKTFKAAEVLHEVPSKEQLIKMLQSEAPSPSPEGKPRGED